MKLRKCVFTTALSLQFNLIIIIESNIFGGKWCHFTWFLQKGVLSSFCLVEKFWPLEYFFWFVGDVLKTRAFRERKEKKSTGLGYGAWRPLNWSYHSFSKNFWRPIRYISVGEGRTILCPLEMSKLTVGFMSNNPDHSTV